MKINFEITNLPEGQQCKYYIAYLEGILKISIGQTLFFSQCGIPLIEFAVFIDKWLKNVKLGKIIDFIYESMDHDEPLLTLHHIKENYFKIDSIWKEIEVTELLFKAEIIIEFENYIANLTKELRIRFGIDLNSILEDGRF